MSIAETYLTRPLVAPGLLAIALERSGADPAAFRKRLRAARESTTCMDRFSVTVDLSADAARPRPRTVVVDTFLRGARLDVEVRTYAPSDSDLPLLHLALGAGMGTMLTGELLPDTILDAAKGRPLGDLVELPFPTAGRFRIQQILPRPGGRGAMIAFDPEDAALP